MARMAWRKALLAMLFAVFASSAALAWGQFESRKKVILNDQVRIRSRDGRAGMATYLYEVNVAFQINEGHNGWGRTCQFSGQSRSVERTLTIRYSDGEEIPFGKTTVALPNATSYNFNQPCSDVVGQLEQKFGEQAGNYQTWQSDIAADLSKVRRTIAIFNELDN